MGCFVSSYRTFCCLQMTVAWMVLALLYGACASGSSHEGSDKATCKASGDCRSTGNSALLQQRTARHKISVEPKEEFVEELPSDEPEYDRQIAVLKKGLPADLQAGGVELIYDSNKAGNCVVCPANQYIFRDEKLAGRLEPTQPPITCKAANDYMELVGRFMPCPSAPSQWIERCCRESPTPAPTPSPPTPAPPTPTPPPRSLPGKRNCPICENMNDMAWHFYAGEDKQGLYTCTRAQNYIERADAKASCAKGREWWRETCCESDKKIHCHMCPRGLKDIKRWSVAGDYFGKIYTCMQLHNYMHSKALKKPSCTTVQQRSRDRKSVV